MTHSYTSHIENWPHSYNTIFQILPIHILFGWKRYPLIYFWWENDAHSYSWRPEKYTPSSRTSVYTFIMEVNPPPVHTLLIHFTHSLTLFTWLESLTCLIRSTQSLTHWLTQWLTHSNNSLTWLTHLTWVYHVLDLHDSIAYLLTHSFDSHTRIIQSLYLFI